MLLSNRKRNRYTECTYLRPVGENLPVVCVGHHLVRVLRDTRVQVVHYQHLNRGRRAASRRIFVRRIRSALHKCIRVICTLYNIVQSKSNQSKRQQLTVRAPHLETRTEAMHVDVAVTLQLFRELLREKRLVLWRDQPQRVANSALQV